MKKIFYLASIAALAFSSCTKDETTEANLGTVGGSKIVAAMEADDTRTQLDANGTYKWSAGDQLGVYGIGAHTLNNAAFVLDNSAANSAVGVFASQATTLEEGKTYLAVYPRLQKSIISEVGLKEVVVPHTNNSKIKVFNDDYKVDNVSVPLNVEILDVQKYQNGSFYTNTAPAISSSFVVSEDGATVDMQPVVDYLFVNIKSTEPIETLTLKLRTGTTFYKLAGTTALKGYFYGQEYRYYAPAPTGADAKDAITLETDESYKSIVCHEPNTYVFTIPAGILGMNKNVEAFIYVNGEASASIGALKTVTDAADKNYIVENTHLNVRYIDQNGDGSAETATNRTMQYPNGDLFYQQENSVFWMNPVVNGERTSFMYNPNNDYIIEHEGQLLKYLTEYNSESFSLRDAFICSEYAFDFSLQNMRELTTELKADGTYNEFQVYISNYLADDGTFPCIENYVNEFKGNGAVISNIVRPLAKNNGIFGNIKEAKSGNTTGKISDITFSGIIANNDVMSNYTQTAKVNIPGYILGSMKDGKGSISNVTVDNAQGRAILKEGDVADYKNLTVTNAEGLEYVIFDMNLNDNLTPANWDAVKAVKTTVFNSLDATGHKVVKLPAGADYADLASYVGTGLNYDTLYNDYKALALGTPSYDYTYGSKAADQSDNNVVSVLIGEDSYWTGDKTNRSMALPETVGGTGADAGYYKLEYAEQLAMGADADNSARVMRNMHLESAVNAWKMVTVKHLDGNNKTISGVRMNGLGLTTVAPVDAETVKNLTVDGVTLDLMTAIANGTTNTVPTTISGLAVDAKTITNVTVNNLVIDAYAYDGTNNTEAYYGNTTSIIGWMVAKGTDTYITDSKVNGVNSNVRGLAGLVGEMTLVEGAQIKNSAATNVTKAQADITDFAQLDTYSHKNLAGTAVAVVKNAESNPKDIKFVGIGKPAFLYDSTNGITVVYDSVESKTYKNL